MRADEGAVCGAVDLAAGAPCSAKEGVGTAQRLSTQLVVGELGRDTLRDVMCHVLRVGELAVLNQVSNRVIK